MDAVPRKKWWLIPIAGVLAVMMLYYYTGSWVAVGVFVAAIGAFVIYQATRSAKISSHTCVRCGAALNPNARECKFCGSASWTVRD